MSARNPWDSSVTTATMARIEASIPQTYSCSHIDHSDLCALWDRHSNAPYYGVAPDGPCPDCGHASLVVAD
jgi:hypothetical protein